MSNIPELSITGGLGSDLERILPFVDVSRYKKIRLCVLADTILLIQLEWSYDGKTAAVATSFRCPSDMHKTETYDVVLPYVRLKIQNHSGRDNLILNTYTLPSGVNEAVESVNRAFPVATVVPLITGVLFPAFEEFLIPLLRKEFGHIFNPPEPTLARELPPPIAQDPIASEIKERAKSPFFKRKKETTITTKHVACLDHRLPQFLPVGAILVGDKQGRATVLPKGLPGDILKMGADGMPHWVSEFAYPPTSDPRTTALLDQQRTVKWEKEEDTSQ